MSKQKKHKIPAGEKMLACHGCGEMVQVDEEDVKVTCWRCVNELLRGLESS